MSNITAASKPRYRWNGNRWTPACSRARSIGTMAMFRSRGQTVLLTPSVSQYKTAAARLAEALGGRWSHRAGGYVMASEARAAAAIRLHAAGWDGGVMERTLTPPAGTWSRADVPRGARLAA